MLSILGCFATFHSPPWSSEGSRSSKTNLLRGSRCGSCSCWRVQGASLPVPRAWLRAPSFAARGKLCPCWRIVPRIWGSELAPSLPAGRRVFLLVCQLWHSLSVKMWSSLPLPLVILSWHCIVAKLLGFLF